MLGTIIFGFAGFGCAVIVFLIVRCISRAWQDLKIIEKFAEGEDW
jgi:hypothetical protein